MPNSRKTASSKNNSESILFKCLKCNSQERIPKEVVDFFDIMDTGDTSVPPRFDCQLCSGKMQPVHYINHDGIEYKL